MPDVPHKPKEHILDYEDDVHRRVNPDAPIPRGFAVRVVDPLTGRVQYIDDCFQTSGDLVDKDMKPGDFGEGKAEEFNDLVNDPWIGHLVRAKLVATAKKIRAEHCASRCEIEILFRRRGSGEKDARRIRQR